MEKKCVKANSGNLKINVLMVGFFINHYLFEVPKEETNITIKIFNKK